MTHTVEKRMRNNRDQPNFNVNYYIVNSRGDFAGASLSESRFAVCAEAGPQTLPTEALFAGRPTDWRAGSSRMAA
jgi:hypothetical protein